MGRQIEGDNSRRSLSVDLWTDVTTVLEQRGIIRLDRGFE